MLRISTQEYFHPGSLEMTIYRFQIGHKFVYVFDLLFCFHLVWNFRILVLSFLFSKCENIKVYDKSVSNSRETKDIVYCQLLVG